MSRCGEAEAGERLVESGVVPREAAGGEADGAK